MLRLLVFLTALLVAFPLFAEDWTTADGKVYKNVTIVAEEDDGVRVTYDGGVGKLPYYELPVDVQKRLGKDIDALKAKKEAADKALADAMASASAMDQQKQQEAAAAAQAQKAQQAQAATATANGQPAGSPASGAPGSTAVPGASGTPGQTQQPKIQPGTASSASSPGGPLAPPDPYPGARYSYNEPLDISYLESFASPATPEPPADSSAPAATAPAGSLTLRIASDGRQPYAPAKIEAIFTSNTAVKNPGNYGPIGLFVNGLRTAMHDIEIKDTNTSSTPGPTRIAFYLTPEQVRSINFAKTTELEIGAVTYQFDDIGMASMRRYFDAVDQLPPPPTGWAKSYRKFVHNIPAMIAAISTGCEYIVIGSFAILVIMTIAAFAMGMSRFIQM
jgi:hypothetical protein